MLKAGDRAPAFTLDGSDGERVSSKDFKGQPLVIYFYPKDDTPGCTLEAQDFQRRAAAVQEAQGRARGSEPRLHRVALQVPRQVRLGLPAAVATPNTR